MIEKKGWEEVSVGFEDNRHEQMRSAKAAFRLDSELNMSPVSEIIDALLWRRRANLQTKKETSLHFLAGHLVMFSSKPTVRRDPRC